MRLYRVGFSFCNVYEHMCLTPRIYAVEYLQLSSQMSTPASTYEDGGTCLWNIHGSTKRLCVEICALILQSGFYSHHDETVSLDPHLASLLMNIQISHSGTSYECPRKQKVSVTPYPRNVSLFEASATPEACMSSRNWRQTLIDRFSRETDRQYGFVVAAVGEICRDLENRCEGIEKPLRDEQEITNQLRAEVLGLKSRSTDLEDVIGRQNIALEESMRDNDQLRIKLNEAVSKAQKCTDRVEQLEELVEVARQDAKQSLVEFHRLSEITALEHRQALNAIRDSADRTAMENMTVLNERQDNIDQLIETRHQLEENLERQKMEYMEETTKLQGKNQKLFEKIALLEKELTQGLLKLQAEKAETLKRNDKIEELEQGLSEIEEEDEKLRDQLRVSKNIVQELEAKLEILGLEKLRMSKDHIEALQNLSNEHATKVDQLQMVHERHVETLAKQKVHDDQTHSDEMHKLRETLNKNCLDWTHERESLQSENRILAKSIHKLQTHQEQKEKEAQVLTRQLLGLMTGGGSDSSGFTHLLTSGSNSSNNNNENCSTSNLPTMTTRRKSFSMDGEPVSKRPKRQSHPTVKPIIQQHLKSTGKSSELCEVTAAFSGSAPTSEMYEEETQKDERELCDSNGNSENETHHFDTNTSTKQSELMPEFEETMDF
ncbi:hypothetical protein EDC01DRAFT_198268 [Geopyxis carbonaria]|nr:hypothetical protein EDC01DRAFT_198268 [Geopyxis carbonaria]